MEEEKKDEEDEEGEGEKIETGLRKGFQPGQASRTDKNLWGHSSRHSRKGSLGRGSH